MDPCTTTLRHAAAQAPLLEVGRVPGDYPIPAGYCTTRRYPDPARYYFKIWPEPGNLSRLLRLSALCHAVKVVKRKVGICLVTVFDA